MIDDLDVAIIWCRFTMEEVINKKLKNNRYDDVGKNCKIQSKKTNMKRFKEQLET